MRPFRFAFLALLLLSVAFSANADTWGVPVTASGSTTQAVPTCPGMEGVSCFNSATGAITFYIPLERAQGGTFGVTPHAGGTAGTYSDVGNGATNTLTMFMMFSPVGLPVTNATLTFSFVDLDLSGWNDPNGFFESIRFYDANGNALTPLITSSSTAPGALTFIITGNGTAQTIFFPNVTSILTDPFWVQINFGSAYNQNGRNTPETIIGSLHTTPYVPPPPPPNPVPEPATMGLMASGLAAIAVKLRRRSR